MWSAAGFTLVEVLVAVFVLAVGIVGGVSMQLAAMRARHQSALLAQASLLAADAAERLRANPSQLQLPDGVNPYLTLDYDALDQPPPAPPAVSCHAAPCDPSQLAWFDLYDIKSALRARLPGGRVVICRDAGLWQGGVLSWPCSGGAGAPLVVKVGWRGKRADGTPQTDRAGQYAPGVALTIGLR
ncbi:pilus assembly protein PilV [Duganella sp. Leaf126]|nr:pilus assembly protein PilV [Duganella sp. Leaf126]